MDESRFDGLTRKLANGMSRRHTLQGLAGGLAGLLAHLGLEEASAACVKPGQKGCKGPRNKKCCQGATCKGGSKTKTGKCGCKGSLTKCGAKCVNTQTNAQHCGGCNTSCDAAPCARGACACSGSLTRCGTSCVNTQTDTQHCGGCNNPCGEGQTCDQGGCQGGQGMAGEIVFVNNFQIWTINADGTGLSQLTNRTGGGQFPAWSPDRTRIAFVGIGADNQTDIFRINANGSDLTNLTNNTNESSSIYPTWSPDGSRIAFLGLRVEEVEKGLSFWTMAADGGNPTRVGDAKTSDRFLAWSPDGTRIAFDGNRPGDGRTQIYTMSVGNGSLTRLSDGTTTDEMPNWSPDGTTIAVSSPRGGDLHICTMPAGGGASAILFSGGNSPAWSPDGSEIVFAGTDGSISTMSAGGGDPTSLTEGWDPDW